MLELPGHPGMAEGWLSLRAAETRGQEGGGMGDSSNLDDSLTSLQWLQEFSIINANVGKSSSCPSGPDPHDYHRLPGFAAPCSPLAADPACMGMPHTPGKPTSSSTSRTAPPAGGMQPPAEDIDYKSNPHVKPPYSYATLICMAMEASKKTKITLSAIYKWITDNFCYFRHADPTWQVGASGRGLQTPSGGCWVCGVKALGIILGVKGSLLLGRLCLARVSPGMERPQIPSLCLEREEGWREGASGSGTRG